MEINIINQYLKETLETYYESNEPGSQFKVSAKHIIHINEDEFNILNKSKLIYSINVTRLRFAVLDIYSKNFLAIVGTNSLFIDNTDFLEVSINNVIFLSVTGAINLKINENVSTAYIRDVIYPIEEEEKNKTGYELNSIKDLFEPFIVLEVPSQEVQNEFQIKAHIAKILLENSKYTYLDFAPDTIKSYIEYFNSCDYDDNIFNSILAYCWRYCFLDVYRCMEPLFRHIPLHGLKSEINFTGSIDDLYEKIYNHCGWRPQETSSMETLFTSNYLTEELLEKLRLMNIGESPDENVGKSIYRLRNKIVHHQGVLSDIETSLTIENWNKLISYLLDSLMELRKKILHEM